MSNTDKLADALRRIIAESDLCSSQLSTNYLRLIERGTKALLDYRASKEVSDDELVKKLEEVKASCDRLSWCTETQKKNAGVIEQALSRIRQAPRWVKIEDIPESMVSTGMKDGMVDLLLRTKCGYSYTGRIMDDGEIWTNDPVGEMEAPVYASHIPVPPQEEE